MSVLKIAGKMYWLRKAERLDRGQIEALRKRRLRRLLKYVLTRSRFYQNYYRRHGITIDNIDQIGLRDIPPIDKEIVMDNFDDLVCNSSIKRKDVERFISDPSTVGKKYRGRYQVIHTSGSTGTIGIFLYSSNEWNLARALIATRVLGLKIHPFRVRHAFVVKLGGHYGGATLCQAAPNLFFKQLAVPIDCPLEEMVRVINDFQPDFLTGYASGLYLLAQQQIKGSINIRPRKVISSAEPLTCEMKQAIVSAFNIQPVDFYAACESIVIGASCDSHQGFHLFDDWHCLEVVDGDGKDVAVGSSGWLILTNLYNYTQPLIRYRMSDKIVLDDEKCLCGRPFVLMKDFVGRSEEMLWFERTDGRRECIHPSTIADFFVPGLEKFQLIQVRPNRLLMKVVVNDGEHDVASRIHRKMWDILRARRLDKVVRFETQVVRQIASDPRTGKFKLIVPFDE